MVNSSTASSLMAKLILVILCLCLVFLLLTNARRTSSFALAQTERVFENTIPKDVPIKIKIKKEKEESFKDLKNEKWLREFELELTNTGTKPIYFVFINLATDVKVGEDRLVFPLSYGRPELSDIVTRALPNDLPIKPGETYVLKMGEVPGWERGVREGRWPQATKFRAELQSISFGDGTGFFGNHPYPENGPPNAINKGTHGFQGKPKLRQALHDTTGAGPKALTTLEKPASFLPANFLFAEESNPSLASAEIELDGCMFPECVKVSPWSGYVCWDNLERPSCRIQNRPNPDPLGSCRELVYDKVVCTAGVVDYFCQTITVFDCGLGPGPTPTPTPTPERCQYCTDPNAIGPADCSNPAQPKCDFFPPQFQQNGCCYLETCEHAGVPTPTPPPPCQDGYHRLNNEIQPFPVCDYLPCVPFPPELVGNQNTCQSLSYYWNFTSSSCGSTPAIGMCGGGPDWTNYFTSGCYSGLSLFSGTCGRSGAFISHCMNTGDYDAQYCICTGCDSCGGSPILVDVNGDGFSLTDVKGGVRFDLNGNGTRDRLSWTAPGTDDAWLALDRNGNGIIDNGQELFGDLTPQPSGRGKNGFIALAEFDKAEHGGIRDGVIDKNDSVFARLKLWQDKNHNGRSETGELHSLPEMGLKKLELYYTISDKTDQYGNEFRYRARVLDTHDAQLGRWAWDVFLLSSGP
jgi:hypothetical protein